MTPQQSANVLGVFHGAYPRVEIDEATVAVWQNSLAVADYDVAMRAAEEWVQIQRWWPSIAEFNQAMTALRQDDARSGSYRLPERTGQRFGCDGTGWVDRGHGLEPCPTCNPWNEALVENGDWQNLRITPPREWVQPMPCRPVHTESELFDFQQARAAVERGYREHHAEVGTPEDEVDRKLDELFRRGEPTVGAR